MRAVCLLALLAALAGCRQSEQPPPEAQIVGTITDRDSGMLLGNVSVRAESPSSNGTTTSIADGTYRIEGLVPGVTYSVVATGADYEPMTIEIAVAEGPNTVDFPLTLRRICTPGMKRCPPPGLPAAILTCNDAGTDYVSTACPGGQACNADRVECVRQATLSVMVTGAEGIVRSAPAGINCPPDCTAEFETGTQIILTPSPEQATTFGAWTAGPCFMAPFVAVCMLTLNADASVTVRFDSTWPRLGVAKTGMGGGRVSSMPAGIDCGNACGYRFPPGTMVTLTAAPDNRSTLGAWTNCTMTMGNTCLVNLAMQGLNVAVRFDPFYLVPLTADAACRTLIHFDPTSRFTQACGGGPDAVATGTTSFVASRFAALGEAIELIGPASVGAIDSMKPGPVPPTGTVEMTIHRLGNAFDGSGYAVLFSDQSIHADGVAGFRMIVRDDGRLAASAHNGMGGMTAVETPADAIAVGQWYQVAASFRSDRLRLSIDGMTAAETPGPIALTASSSTAWIGAARADAFGGASHRFNGRIDEVRVSATSRY